MGYEMPGIYGLYGHVSPPCGQTSRSPCKSAGKGPCVNLLG